MVDKCLSPIKGTEHGLLSIIVFWNWGFHMKEIGEKLKETRESMGISIEEAAEDLKLRPSQLTNIEEGNRDAFKDIFYLKIFHSWLF